jgi:hypothetical protein
VAHTDRTPIRVTLDREVEQLLIENETDLVTLLQRSGEDVRKGPGSSAGDGRKEPVTILLATAALVVSLTPILTRALGTLSRKRIVITEKVPVAVTDPEGNVVRDASGDPVTHLVDRHRMLESEPVADPRQKLEIKGPLELHISYESSPGP